MDTPPLQRCDSGDSGRVSSTSDSLTFSPDLGLSPVSNLSFSLGFLSCLDSITPRRRLKLSPGSKSPSPEASCSVATETPTLTGACLESPSCTCNSDSQTPARCCSPAPRRHPDKKQRRGEGGFKAPPGKENKRFRMRLACLFTSPNQPQREDGSSNGSRAWYQKKGRSDTKLEAVVEHPRVISHFHDSQSSLVVDTEQILDTRAEDKNLIGDFSKPHLFPVENGKHQDLKYISPAMRALPSAPPALHKVIKNKQKRHLFPIG